MGNIKINTENYESFYLDYLEGNLGENDTIELFAFLSDHPEFQVEDELLVLENEDISLGQDFKNLLKSDLASQEISLNTIDFFLIAQKEGQLNDQQLGALDAFLIENPQFKKDQKMYALSTLNADTSIVYADKKNLKQRAAIVLWPYYSAMAAACAVLFFWFMPATPSGLSPDSVAKDLNPRVKVVPQTQVAEGTQVIEQNDFSAKFANDTEQDNNSPRKDKLKLEIPQNKKLNVANNDTPNHKNDKPVKLKHIDNKKLENISIAIASNNKENNEVQAITAMNDNNSLAMKDVARPVTRKISDIIKSDVKMKKGTDAKGKREGVFLKVGNFEFYRNKKVKQ